MSTSLFSREHELAARFLALPKERRARLFAQLSAQGIDLALLPIPRVPHGPERERLAHAQERLWFLAQLDPDSTRYNMPGALRLRGALDRAALSTALQAIVTRHEALRTTFPTVRGVARAHVHGEAKLELHEIDARAEFARTGDACVRSWAEREAGVVFDLERGPLVRVSLVQFADADFGLFVCLHHIVSDGWSLRVFIDEFVRGYAAKVTGGEPPTAALPIQYADYAAWQRSWLEAGELDKQLAYWRGQLAGVRDPLQLPSDRPRPPEREYRGALVEVSLPSALAHSMRQRARAEGVTLFMLGVAAWKALLHRVTGAADICVGSNAANRTRLETENLIGCFVNTQVLRTQPSSDLPFARFLAAVKQVALEAQSHQDLPFDALVEALAPERSLSFNPLFQVHYDHQQRAYSELTTLPGLELEPIASEHRTALFDLMLTAIELPDGAIRVQLEYATDIFDPPTAEALAGGFERVLEQVVDAPDLRLGELSLGACEALHARHTPDDRAPKPVTARSYVPPAGEIERELCAIWQELLQLPRVSATDNFFEVGGDSIVSIQVVSRARERGIALRPKDLFQHPTPRGLASVAKSVIAASASPEAAGDIPLTPIQASFFARGLPDPNHFNQSLLLECREELDVRALERAFAAVIAQHDALRTAFRRERDGWSQRVLGMPEFGERRCLTVAHLRDRDEIEALCDAAQRSLELSRGELVRALYLRLHEGGSRLFIAIHHLVIDGVSWRVLLEDLQRAYIEARAGREPALRERTHSFGAWARRLEAHAASPVLARELPYWREVTAQLPALPSDLVPQSDALTIAAVESFVVRIGREATERLLKHSAAAYRTHVHELLLAALSRALCDTFDQPAVAVMLEGHGREDLFDDADVSRTVGWFTTEYPVVLRREGDVSATIRAVKDQLRAVPSRGLGYGLLAWLAADAQQMAAERPKVSFNYLGQFDASFGAGALFRVATERSGADAASDTPLSDWIAVSGQVYAGELSLAISFSTELYRHETIERLGTHFEAALHEVIAHCTSPGAGALTPSDFPLAALSVAELAIVQQSGEPLEEIYRVTPLQHGILFHALLESEPGIYVTQLAVTIDGLDPARFVNAWQRALERHPILRTSFRWEGLREPVQCVSSSATLDYVQLDLRASAEPARELERIAAAQHHTGFDLRRAPLWRIALVQLDSHRYQFIWTHHHLLLDGWSTARLLDEVLLDYLGRPVPEPSRPFIDYVAWLYARDRSASEAFWRGRLRELNEPTLFAGHLMGALANGEAATRVELVRSRVSAADTVALAELASREHVTLNTLVQSAWSILLARYTGQTQVLFGVTTSGRPPELSGSERMLGLFINTLPVLASVPPSAALSELWGQLQASGLEAREHEQAPLSDIQRWAERGGELFDTLVVFENFPLDRNLAGDWQSLSFGAVQSVEITNYALTLAVRPGAELELDCAFDPARVPASAVKRLAAQLLGLLRDFRTAPRSRVSDLVLCGEPARQVASEGDGVPFVPVHEAIAQRLRARSPQRASDVMVTGAGSSERWTASELLQRSGSIANVLRALGLPRESKIGLYVERGPWVIAGALGILQAGYAYVPLDPAYPRERLEWMVADAAVEVVLGHGWLQPIAAARTLSISDLTLAPRTLTAATPELTVHPDQLAYVIYTSGSTGKPKGVAVSHGALAMHARAVAAIYQNSESDCALHMASASFDAAVEQWVVPLISGARVVLSDGQSSTVDEMLATLRSEQVTIIYPPTSQVLAVAEWLEHTGEQCTLRVVCVGGEAVSRESVALIRRTLQPQFLVNGYGPTETVVTPTLWRATAEQPCETAYAPIGWIVGDRSAHVLDPDLNVQPRGVAGELYLGGTGMARGYLGRPALTAERFVPDPFSVTPGARLYRTGDRVRALEDGTIEYLDRIDQQVKLRGHRIELGEIEARLLAEPEVNDAVVVLRKEHAPRLVAYIGVAGDVSDGKPSRLPNSEDLAARLLARLRAALPDYMVPAQLVALDRLPRTANGKVDRAALPAPEPLGREAVAARTELERAWVGYFEQVLGERGIGVRDDFFERGGDSLRSLQLVSRARAAGHAIGLKDVFGLRTVEAIAQFLEAAGREAPAARIEPSAVREGLHELSYAQERLWFLAQLDPDSMAYTISAALRFRGRLDAGRVQQAFDRLIERHAALRTSFESVDGRGMQRVHAALRVPIERVDVRAVGGAGDVDTRARAWLRTQSERPFDLARAPLLRVSLLQLGDAEHILAFSLHHLVADGWSLELLTREFARLYAAEDFGAAAAPTAIAYSDYAAWQRGWLDGGEGARQLAYWREVLGEEHPVLSLPADHQRPRVQSHRGGLVEFELDADTTQQVAELARARGTTVFAVLLAAFESVLYRVTGQRDLRIGVPVSNRNRVDTEDVVGLFVNTLVLRTEVEGTLSFEALLARVHDTALSAQANQDLPFERLVEALSPERSLSHNPLFQVMYDHQRAALDALRALPELHASAFETELRTAQVDLTLATLEADGQIRGSFTYAADLFEPATIEALSQRYLRTLRAAVRRPSLRVSELPMLADAERSWLLEVGSPRIPPAKNEALQFMHAVIARRAAENPLRVALRGESPGDVWTYARLDRESNLWARRLRAAGVGPEVRVGLCVGRSPRMVLGALAILKSGGAYVPLDPSHPPERLRSIIADAGLKWIVSERSQPAAAELSAEHGLWLDEADADTDSFAHSDADAPLELSLSGDSLAYIVYTSGSTGRPKGVGVTHAALAQHMAAIGADYAMSEDDCALHFASLSFDAGTEQWLNPLLHGATLVVRGDSVWSAERALEVLRAERVTFADMPPAYLREVAQLALERHQSLGLRACVVGGEALAHEALQTIVRALGSGLLINGYGPTEAVITPLAWHASADSKSEGAYAPIGRPIGVRGAYVLDTDLNLVPAGATGELYVSGDCLARGYVDHPSWTAERFVPDPYAERAGARMYRTGDLARVRADGQFEFVGRWDHQVKLRGFRIELGEVEALLAARSGVREAAVVAVGGAVASRLIGYVAGELDVAALRAELQAAAPQHLIPSQFVVLESLPRDANGKVDRKRLPAPQADAVSGAAPRTPVEAQLCEIFEAVLGLPCVGISDNFFALGGDSIRSLQVVSRAQKLGLALEPRDVFEGQTPERLAALTVRRDAPAASAGAPLVPIARDAAAYPLSFAQERLWFLAQLEPASAAYNIAGAVQVRGIDERALQRAVDALVARHEALRTTFEAEQGEPRQRVHAAGDLPVPLEVHDLQYADASRAREIVEVLAHAPFDLERGPLVRVAVVRLADGEQVIALAMHHMISDGWSVDLAIAELCALYAGVKLPEPAIQYVDYAVWQRHALEAGELTRQLDYWKRQLGTEHPVLEVPADRARPKVQTFRGDAFERELDASLGARLHGLAAEHGVTLYMLLLAAWQTLLYRVTGQSDIRVGVPATRRNRVETEAVIGIFVDMQVLRSEVRGELRFSELLRHVRTCALDASAHADVPFEQLVEALRPERSLSHNPLFQVTYNHASSAAPALVAAPDAAARLELRAFAWRAHSTQFDLSLDTEELPGQRLRMALTYATDLFEAATADALVTRFECLLEQIVAHPDVRVAELELLTPDELAIVEPTLEGPRAVSPVHIDFNARAAERPDTIALECGGEQYTYAQLDHASSRWAHRLRRAGVRAEVRVGVCVERSMSAILAPLAIWKAGGVYVPLDPAWPVERLRELTSDARLRVVLSERTQLRDAVWAGAHTLLLDVEDVTAEPIVAPEFTSSGTELAYVLYTSGSTGVPKGVGVSYAALALHIAAIAADYELQSTDCVLQFASTSFDTGLEQWLAPLLQGARVVMRGADVWTPRECAEELRARRITRIDLPPGYLHALASELRERGEVIPLRSVISGGEALPSEHLSLLGEAFAPAEVINAYGPTEAVVTPLTWHAIEDAATLGPFAPIGRPIGDRTCYVLDPDLRLVPPGVIGELYLGGSGLARGYLDQPARTAERFVPDPFTATPGARLYRTGDRVRRLVSGVLEYVGRTDDQVKIRGFRVELGEIAARIRAQPGVREVAVVALHSEAGPRIVAYIAGTVSLDALQLELRAALPDYMCPSQLIALEALPRTAAGKLDRARLPAAERIAGAFVAPRNPTEVALCRIWEEVLGVARVSVTDNFFELGGHSLLVMKALSRIRTELGFELAVRPFFEAHDLASLAAVLSSTPPGAAQDELVASALEELEGLSDDELARVLAEES